MHLSEDKIEQLLDGELPEHEAQTLRDHLAACGACVEAFEAARLEDRDIARLLGSLDHHIPDVDPSQLRVRARRRALRPRLAAASIALLVVAGAAYAMPGSPLRSWFARVFPGDGETAESLSRGDEAGIPGTQPAGVSVLPSGRFELVFEANQESGLVRISLAAQAEVAVQSDREGVGYSVEPSGVRVLNAGSSANYQVVIPRDAESVSIRVRDSIVFKKQRATIVTSAARDDAGRYVLDLSALSR